MSNVMIADAACVSEATVRRMRASASSGDEAEAKRLGRDGKEYKLPTPRAPAEEPPPSPQEMTAASLFHIQLAIGSAREVEKFVVMHMKASDPLVNAIRLTINACSRCDRWSDFQLQKSTEIWMPRPPTPRAMMRSAADSLRHALDPTLFAREILRFNPDPWQSRVLRTDARRVILTCSRQSGKSSTAAVLAVHKAVHDPGALVLLVSPTQRQSAELFGKCSALMRQMPTPPKLLSDSVMSCRFKSGSRIVALPGDAAGVRGYSAPALVLADESAFIQDDLFASVQPMLAVSNGALWLMSTPNGRQGFHYNVWMDGGDDWHRERIAAEDCPRITAEFLAEEERLNGPHYMRTEYRCEFLEGTHQFFSDEAIQAVMSPDLPRLNIVF